MTALGGQDTPAPLNNSGAQSNSQTDMKTEPAQRKRKPAVLSHLIDVEDERTTGFCSRLGERDEPRPLPWRASSD
ncbi:hypothetical protein ACWELP_04810 [Rhodococcus aetherivorans]